MPESTHRSSNSNANFNAVCVLPAPPNPDRTVIAGFLDVDDRWVR